MANFENSFKHPDLEHNRHIRLLQISQDSEHDKPNLVGTVKSFNLDIDCPDYDALSYTWGPPLNTAECIEAYGSDNDVIVALDNGEHTGFMTIGRNLAEALAQLWHLKNKQVSGEAEEIEPVLARWIWTDAICIDQQNETEKSQQVAIMNEIYSKARTVLAWLGKDDGTFDDVAEFHVECVDKMAAWIRYSDSQEVRVPAGYERVAGGYLIRDIGIKMSEGIVRSVALFFFQRRYLLRLWICQELALAKSPFVLLGHRMLPFRVFATCGQFLKYNKAIAGIFAQAGMSQIDISQPNFGSFENLDVLRMLTQDLEEPKFLFKGICGKSGDDREVFCFSLLMAIEQCHLHTCSDPRDRIFAILAIAKSSVSPDFIPPLVPDYSISYEQLRVETTSLLLNTLPHLSLLSAVNHKRGETTVQRPSWMPTFGLEHSGKANSIYWTRIVHPLGRSNPFKASGKFSSPSGISGFTKSELKLVGRQVGVVRACFLDVVTSEKTVAAQIQAEIDLMLFLLESFDELAQHDRTGLSIFRLILQTLTLSDLEGDLVYEETYSCRAWLTGGIAIIRHQQNHSPLTSDENIVKLSKALEKIAGILGAPAEHEVQDWMTALAEEEVEGATIAKYNRESTRFLSDYLSGCLWRGIFRTEDSMGIGTSAMLPGDQIWVLVPGRVLYILRPTEDQDRFLFIGEAYLNGVMFGGAVDGLSEDELTDITLI